LYRPEVTSDDIQKYPKIVDYIKIFHLIPNFLALYLNYSENLKTIRNMIYGEGVRITEKDRILTQSLTRPRIDRIFFNIMELLMQKYPEAFKYLIQNDLLSGSYKNLDKNKIKWILIFDDPELISKLPINHKNNQELFKSLLGEDVGPNIFDHLFKLLHPYPTVDDYLNLFKHGNIRDSIIDHIIKLIGNVDKIKIYNFFYDTIVDSIYTYDLNYMWNKYRDLFTDIEKQGLRKIAKQRNYLLGSDELPLHGLKRTFE
jgi:hypothetical protein